MVHATDEIDKVQGPNAITSEYTREEGEEVHETRLQQGKATADSCEEHTDSSNQYR
jgi:hypothetical protein